MQVSRIYEPDYVDLIKNKLTTELDQDTCAELIKNHMREAPESVCFLVAHENDKIYGFVISQTIPQWDYVFIAQIWTNQKGLKSDVVEALGARTMLWGHTLGKRRLRGETARSTEALFRRWRFEEVSRIVEKEIPETFAHLVDEKSKEFLQWEVPSNHPLDE